MSFIPPQLRAAALIGVAALLFLAGWATNGLRYRVQISSIETGLAEAQSLALTAAREVERVDRERLAAIAKVEALSSKEAEVVTRTIVREVTKYVETEPAVCTFPATAKWVRLFDAAAAGRVPPAAGDPGEPDAAAGDVTDAEILEVVTDNFRLCNAAISRLALLQEAVSP